MNRKNALKVFMNARIRPVFIIPIKGKRKTGTAKAPRADPKRSAE
jgi:hypothetical protein